MESQENHVAYRSSKTLVVFVKIGLVGTVMPPAGAHERLERDLAVSRISKHFGDLGLRQLGS